MGGGFDSMIGYAEMGAEIIKAKAAAAVPGSLRVSY